LFTNASTCGSVICPKKVVVINVIRAIICFHILICLFNSGIKMLFKILFAFWLQKSILLQQLKHSCCQFLPALGL
jgi:hypothetical protein